MADFHPDIDASVLELLELSRQTLSAEFGGSTTVESLEDYLEPNDDGAVTGGRRSRKINVLRLRQYPSPLETSGVDQLPQRRRLAGLLQDTYGARCERPMIFYDARTPAFADDPVAWIDEHLCRPLVVAYLTQLNDVSTHDHTLAASLTSELCEALASPGSPHTLRLLVNGFADLATPLTSGDFHVRDLTWEERAKLLDHQWQDVYEVGPITRPRWAFAYPTTVMSLSFDGTTLNREGGVAATKRMACLLAGLSLLGIELSALTAQASIRIQPHWLDGSIRGTGLLPIKVTEFLGPATSVITQELFDRGLQLAGKISKNAWHQPKTHKDGIFHRFMQGITRRQPIDEVFDYVVALESCLVNDKQELRHKFALYGAQFIGTSDFERAELKDQFLALYDLRSALAHGGKFPSQAEIQQGARSAQDLCRRVLLKCLEEGWPEPGELDMQLLSRDG